MDGHYLWIEGETILVLDGLVRNSLKLVSGSEFF